MWQCSTAVTRIQAGLPVGHAWPLPELHWAEYCRQCSAYQECMGENLLGAACVALQEAESQKV